MFGRSKQLLSDAQAVEAERILRSALDDSHLPLADSDTDSDNAGLPLAENGDHVDRSPDRMLGQDEWLVDDEEDPPAGDDVTATSSVRSERLVTDDLVMEVLYDDDAPPVAYFEEVSVRDGTRVWAWI